MKKTILICVGVLAAVATVALANGKKQVVEGCYLSVTNSAQSATINGYLESIRVHGPTAWTGTVTVTSGDMAILTASATTTTNTFRPRVQVHNIVGATLVGATNGYERFYLWSEQMTITVSSLGNITNDVGIEYKWSEK